MAETAKPADPTRIIVGSKKFPVRFSYAWFFDPKIDEKKIDPKTEKPEETYGCMVIIPKNDPDVEKAIKAAVRAAADTKIPGKNIPSMWSLPLRDGDEEWEEKKAEWLKGHWFFNCKSKRRPDVVGAEKVTAEDVAQWDEDNELESDKFKAKNRPKVGELVRLAKDDFKSGDYGRVAVRFYYFENETKGVAVSLEKNVQKLKDGEALGGVSVSAETDFDDDMEEGFAD